MARIVNCLSTEEQAIFILKEHGFQLINNNSHCICECGQTQAVVGYSENQEQVALIGVCESCGDDDAFHDDVINWNRSLLTYTFANGSYIEFFSADQEARLRGARRNIL